MNWFTELTGLSDETPASIQQLYFESGHLHSRANGKSWECGELETVTLVELRQRVCRLNRESMQNSVREIVGNVRHLHSDPQNAHALFQVASQFNLLEMASPGITPECGVGIYEEDYTQGPACAIAAGAGTIFRNYFVDVNGQIGQTEKYQIDCLKGVGQLLGNHNQELWQMVNGYALPSAQGLKLINRKLEIMSESSVDQLRQSLQIGIMWETQVTLDKRSHTVSQVYCSAMPVAYTPHSSDLWAPLATLILEAAYEATMCAAILNQERTGSNQLFLTLLGGGAFGNNSEWISTSITRSLDLYAGFGIDISLVSFGTSDESIRQIVREYNRFP
ncbi:hypothetical protein [Rubinisphaera sp.]|uniref:hypothetical protein n=1 Tax=Rubinisphaera sp. TaxID=2024857 RepID=UPI000C0D7C4D|nr:hypothetical protein [Rubinisphaera sp.]MBV11370.1 hypothetical protein [Rubinisphaera sp.]|tara:strand:- start:1492 stop:2493 length:1002 start_codon:yes stop_codon:yes gene_type:complete